MDRASSIGKRLARSLVTAACSLTTVLGRTELGLAGTLSVLCYHRVLPRARKRDYFLSDLVVTPESFRLHCRMLQSRFDVCTLREGYWRLCDGRFSAKPLAAITFDDGYRDNFEHAAPVLAECGLPATFFVIAGLVGSTSQPWYDRLGQALSSAAVRTNPGRLAALLEPFGLRESSEPAGGRSELSARRIVSAAKLLAPDERRQFVSAVCDAAGNPAPSHPDDLLMDWAQLSQLHGAGHEIGSHSSSHEILTLLDDDVLTKEVVQSKQVLEGGIGAPINSFCYPNGDYDRRVVDAVQAAGYDCAVTIESGANKASSSPFTLRRRFVHEDRVTGLPNVLSPYLLRMELCGLADRLYAWRRNRTPSA